MLGDFNTLMGNDGETSSGVTGMNSLTDLIWCFVIGSSVVNFLFKHHCIVLPNLLLFVVKRGQ